jgi:hypothetical protein
VIRHRNRGERIGSGYIGTVGEDSSSDHGSAVRASMAEKARIAHQQFDCLCLAIHHVLQDPSI